VAEPHDGPVRADERTAYEAVREVAANARSWSVPRGCDNPGRNLVDKLSPQQIGHLLRRITVGVLNIWASRALQVKNTAGS
jgi:hypothetical protein